MRSLGILVPVAGLLLMLVAALPLIQLYESIDNVSISTRVNGDTLIIIFNYNATVDIRDYRLAILEDGRMIAEDSGPVLTQGDRIVLRVSLSSIRDPNALEILFSGKVGGLYYMEFLIHR